MPELLKVFVVVGVIIKRDGKFLMVQEKKLAAYGLWNLPAGRVDKGEKLREAAIREVKEETGYKIKLYDELVVIHDDGDRAVKHVFVGKIIGGELRIPKDEIISAKWYTWEEIKKLKNKLRADWVYNVLEKFEESNQAC